MTPSFKTRVMHGNAVSPYRQTTAEVFHTEFAARLFGFLFCAEAGEFFYWFVTRVHD